MRRTPEPDDLMDDAQQARAYADADFSEPHEQFIRLYREMIGRPPANATVLDLGCGPGDITIRFARAFDDATLDGVDGAEQMLAIGRQDVVDAGLSQRVRLHHGYLPGARLPGSRYDAIISNSLLHHLKDPLALWQTIAAHSHEHTAVFVMDLMRPGSEAAATELVQTHARDEADLLRRDFYNSLLAAYCPEEVEQQLEVCALTRLRVSAVSDRHLVVHG